MTTSPPGDDDACPNAGTDACPNAGTDACPNAGTDACEQASEPTPRHLGWRRFLGPAARDAGTVTGHLVLAAMLGVVAEVVLEVARAGGRWAVLREIYETRPGVLAIGALVLFLVALVVQAAVGRAWIATPVVLGLAAVLGTASHLKFVARHEPLYPGDLVFVSEPGFLLEMVDVRTLWWTSAGLLLLFAGFWGLSRLGAAGLRRLWTVPRRSLPRRVAGVAVRLAVIGVSVSLLSSLLTFNHGSNDWKRLYESAGAHWKRASQQGNYDKNGFIGGFLYNLGTPAMTRPPSYSRAEMARIVDEYSARAETVNARRVPGALDDVNVVSVLSESFSDPTRLQGFTLAEDPIPRIRRLMKRVPHGYMLSQKVGGGTSSMEFEALTGMSLTQFSTTLDTPYQMLVPKHDRFPSAVELFDELGHTAVAIHPYYSTMYQRNRVYPIFGFSDFDSISSMLHHDTLEQNPYISDESAFQETLDALDAHDEPLFVNLVTMQNHAPYDGRYADPIEVEGVTGEDAEMVGQYARGLTYTDQAVADFVKALQRSDEKTIVLFYGDHLPARLPTEVYRNTSFRRMRETPFFIYANFGKVQAERFPTTSPIHFMPLLFELADAPVPPYYALLDSLRQHVSAMNRKKMIGPDNRRSPWEWLSPEGRDVFRDYRLVQYDLSIGKRYAAELFELPPAAPLSASGTAE